jgi:hypothetical protein
MAIPRLQISSTYMMIHFVFAELRPFLRFSAQPAVSAHSASLLNWRICTDSFNAQLASTQVVSLHSSTVDSAQLVSLHTWYIHR